ncbi:MAG: zf-HC2 domain-containing protein [Terriglobia bacterium]|jgi:predicted anti-sigma-YlaC factor YlaD
MFEGCVEIRNHYSDYLDGSCDPLARKSIRFHLSYCASCRQELEGWETMQADLRGMRRLQVPPELALRLRVEVSREAHRKWLGWLRVWLDNVLQPVLLPASGGVLAAVACFCLIMGSLVVPVSNTPDVPLGSPTPPAVLVLAPIDFNTPDAAVIVVVPVDAVGRPMRYRVLSGATSPELLRQLDRVIYFSNFQPATWYGRPTDGQFVLSLRRITVRG